MFAIFIKIKSDRACIVLIIACVMLGQKVIKQVSSSAASNVLVANFPLVFSS